MVCLIQSRTDQIGHTCIEDGKFLLGSLLHIQHFRYQRTALPHDGTPQFKMKCLIRTQFQLSGIGGKIIFEVRDSLTVGMAVIYPQTTTDIYMFYQNPMRFQLVLQFIDTIAQSDEIAHIENLRTDVEVKADKLDILHSQSHVYHFIHILHTDTEFIFGKTGSDIGVSMRAYIRIDAESDIGYFVLSGCQLVDYFKLGNRFYIKTEDSIF